MTADQAPGACRCGTRLARDNTTGLCGACTNQARDLYVGPPVVPRSFWHAEEMREALASWHMGRVIHAYRTHPYHAKPLAQDIVADWMGITQTQLSRIENGEPMQDLGKLIRWAYTLRIPEDLLWFRLPHARDSNDIGRSAVERAKGGGRPAGGGLVGDLGAHLPDTLLVPLQINGQQVTLPIATHTLVEANSAALLTAPHEDETQPRLWTPASDNTAIATPTTAGLEQAELLRRELTDTLSEHALTEASLDDWEQTVLRYGQATRDRPAGLLLADLTIDLARLKRTLSRCRSASALRRLTRLTAQMSGLMCLTLIKLDERAAFRGWAHTARIAADEAGDPTTHSWVLAQEAYGHYYSGDLTEATHVARHAQDIPGAELTVGAVLAAALEARAHAGLGRPDETRTALQHAETILEKLRPDSINTSAFGYNEAQLRFHEGNAFTHLHDTRSAWKAQERALEICPPGDYMDQTLTRLDRASCLLHDGDASAAVSYATDTLVSLDAQQRQGIIAVRAQEIVDSLPKRQQALPPARELHELLMTPADTDTKE